MLIMFDKYNKSVHIGCGTGKLTKALAVNSYLTIGLDYLSPEQIKEFYYNVPHNTIFLRTPHDYIVNSIGNIDCLIISKLDVNSLRYCLNLWKPKTKEIFIEEELKLKNIDDVCNCFGTIIKLSGFTKIIMNIY